MFLQPKALFHLSAFGLYGGALGLTIVKMRANMKGNYVTPVRT
jgi:hypothetical protein